MNNHDSINALLDVLNNSGYRDVMELVWECEWENFAKYSKTSLHILEEKINSIAKDRSVLEFVELFYYTKPVSQRSLDLEKETIQLLSKLEFVKTNRETIQFEKAIYPFDSCYFLAEPQYVWDDRNENKMKRLERPYGSVYIGFDSFLLADYLEPDPGDKVLDVGCGSGICGLTCANTASEVVMVDLSQRATSTSRINAILNDYIDKSHVLRGDIYTQICGKFDYICANPPYLAIPPDLEYPIEGDGGPTGDELLLRIIEDAERYLKPHGELSVITKEFVPHDLKKYFDTSTTILKENLHEFTDIKGFIKTKAEDTYNDPEKQKNAERTFIEHYEEYSINKVEYNIYNIKLSG